MMVAVIDNIVDAKLWTDEAGSKAAWVWMIRMAS